MRSPKRLSRRRTDRRYWLIAALVAISVVLAMRWNVVIGGQVFSKNLRALGEYTPELLGREGLLMAAALVVAPVVLMSLLLRLLPVFDRPTAARMQS